MVLLLQKNASSYPIAWNVIKLRYLVKQFDYMGSIIGQKQFLIASKLVWQKLRIVDSQYQRQMAFCVKPSIIPK